MGAASSVDRVAPEGTRDAQTVLTKGLESGLSQALNASAAAHPEWRQVPPAVSEILQSIAKDMLAVAEKNQSVVDLDMVAVRSTNKVLQARGMGDVASGISQAVNKVVAAHPEWRQVPPTIANVLQSVAKEMLAVAEIERATELAELRRLTPEQEAAAEFERQFAKARAAQDAPTNAALRFGQQFDLLTPMLRASYVLIST